MQVSENDSWFYVINDLLLHVQDTLVYTGLLVSEFSIYWISGRDVASIIVVLSTRIDQEQVAIFTNLVVKVVMQRRGRVSAGYDIVVTFTSRPLHKEVVGQYTLNLALG